MHRVREATYEMRTKTWIALAALTSTTLSLAANATAQTPTQPPPDPPPGSAPPLTPVQPAQPAQPAEGRPGAAKPDGEPKEESGRLRIGFNFNGGVGTGGELSGPTVGGTFRVGYQIDRLMGVYGQFSPLAWIASSDAKVSGKSLDISAIGGYQITPMFSLTPVDLLEIAAGPSLDSLSGGEASAGPTPAGGAVASVAAFSGFYFGLHGRIALHLGGRNAETGRRRGFTLGGDLHPSFIEGETVVFYTLGLGYDWF